MMNNLKVQNPESISEEIFDDSDIKQVLLRQVLTASQVREVESRKKQPQAVLTALYGKPTGFKTLDTSVDPATKASLDEDGNLIMVAPVVGGQY
jgi:hypothetical protein